MVMFREGDATEGGVGGGVYFVLANQWAKMKIDYGLANEN